VSQQAVGGWGIHKLRDDFLAADWSTARCWRQHDFAAQRAISSSISLGISVLVAPHLRITVVASMRRSEAPHWRDTKGAFAGMATSLRADNMWFWDKLVVQLPVRICRYPTDGALQHSVSHTLCGFIFFRACNRPAV